MRNQIQEIALEFPGYGYRRGLQQNSGIGGARSIISTC
jgi:hypothetical protein